MKPIDLFITAYLRPLFTEQTILYLKERTKYPYRLFLINNGGNNDIAEVYKDDIFMTINMSKNAGVTAAWQIALALAESEYFITSDNDIYVPDMQGFVDQTDDWDWLRYMVKYMDDRLDYGAISLHPHTLIGDASFDPQDPKDVKEVPHCGAVMRIMRRDAVKKVNGWADDVDPLIRQDRGHEERLVCSRLREAGYKVGRTTRLRAYHPFGAKTKEPWGYPPEIDQAKLGHNPELTEYVWQYDNMENYDEKTWLPK
jgi:glycosyltransferase involved in cell wall biosynthesis